VRARVRARYLDTIDPWRHGQTYKLPAEFIVLTAVSANLCSP
jgi:hypothetical protein